MNKSKLNIKIIVADYYKEITNPLTKSCIKFLEKNKLKYEILIVPGVYEIPQMIKWKIKPNNYNLFIALGCVIKGQTYHFEVISDSVGKALLDIVSQSIKISYTSLSSLIGIALIWISLWDHKFRRSGNHIYWGIMVGLAISSGWVGTHLIAQYGFEDLRPVSHSFTAPIGTVILYTMTSLGGSFNFAIGSVLGVWGGALIGSLIRGHFRLEGCEDPRELQRQILGAIMMGFGAIFALGCSVGQGLSAMAVLSLNAPIAIISIFIGAKLGLGYLITGRFLFFKS